MQDETSTGPDSSPAQTKKHQAFHAIVHGAVQGVGFRYFTKASAQRAGVTGWVRNSMDGTVEIWAEGTKTRLQQFISAINRGPAHSHVTKVDLTWRAPTGDARSFYIRY
ncbi:MAG: acylphosphatase [Anaerolineae bacterium]|nr:acylphosphatase [Anaerolineae bacterium]